MIEDLVCSSCSSNDYGYWVSINMLSKWPFQDTGAVANSQSTATRGESSRGSSLPANGAEWVELLVGQVLNASHIKQARERVAQALESLQKSICENVITGVQSFQKVPRFISVV